MFRRKYYLDLQVHTARYSPCSRINPEQLVAAARERRLDGLVITEHGRMWSEEEIAELKASAEDEEFVILSGTEVRTSEGGRVTGDLLVFGAGVLPDGPCTIEQVCRLAHGQGGLVVAPHPFAPMVGVGAEALRGGIDGLEVYNYRHWSAGTEREAKRAWRSGGLAGIGSSDAHDLDDVGACCTEFDRPIRTIQDLIGAIQQRRCRPRRDAPPRPLLRK